jgi:tRNA 2-thiouridine synthesizing protein D
MIFSLAVYAPPSSQASDSAYRFANAVITSKQHQLYRVFFYHEGVYTATALSCTPQDETDYTRRWQNLSMQHQVDLVVCIAAALRRGIIDRKEADRYEKLTSNLATHFSLSGLGQLVEASVKSDRLVTFG